MARFSWFDERSQTGRVRSWLFLVHPGPSVLVTAVFVAVAGLAARSVPGPGRALQLVAVMLPIQFTIGIVNDLADAGADAIGKPYKPLVRHAVGVNAARNVGFVLAALGIAVAFSLNVLTGVLVVGGLSAGLLYDVGMRRTLLSVLPWWCGMVLLPLAAFAAANQVSARLVTIVPLGLLVAASLHCANALPDIPADQRAGQRSLPVVIGERASRAVGFAGLLAAVAIVAISLALSREGPAPFIAAGSALLLVGGAAARWAARPFPLLALAAGVLAIVWLGAIAG